MRLPLSELDLGDTKVTRLVQKAGQSGKAGKRARRALRRMAAQGRANAPFHRPNDWANPMPKKPLG